MGTTSGVVRRLEVEKDKERLFEGALSFAAQTEMADEILEDPVGFLGVILQTVQHPDVTVLIYEEDGQAAAGFGFMVQPHYWAPHILYSQELFFFNLSAGPHAALRLLRAYEKEARSMGVRKMNLTHLMTSDPRVGQVYERLGARPIEKTYMKEL